MEEQPPRSDDEPEPLTPPDREDPAVPDVPADKGPSLPGGPFVGGSSAPFGDAMQDEPEPPPPPPPAPETPPASGPGGWIPEGSPVVGGPTEPAPPAEPAGPGGWIPEDSPVFEAGEPAPPPPPSEPVAPPSPSPEPPAYPGTEAAPPPTGLQAGDPLAASPPPAPSGFSAPPAAPGATGAPEQPVQRAEGSIPPPGYTPSPGGYGGYGGGPVPPGAYAPPATAPQPIGNYQLASWGSRAGALIIDSFIIGIASIILIVLIGAIFGGLGSLGGDSGGAVGFWLGVVFAFIPVIIVSFAYQPYWMARTNGQTIGKSALNIRVIRTNGQPTDLGWSALRQIVVIQLLFGIVGSFFLYIPWLLNYLWPLWDEENRALHDMLVNSRVVKA
ncbi:MAG: RDD family protein [Solirubrobacteraceae bacterium]|nr:RDD family protein [Solirubrobacteraceae bacterium]